MFAFPTNVAKLFNTVATLKNNKAVGIADVSAEVVETSLWVTIFNLGEFVNQSLSRGWIQKCL